MPLITAVGHRWPAEAPAPVSTTRTVQRAVSAVVVAVSTGGPNALAEIVPALPADLPVPVFVVQHMPELFTKMLAERLDRAAPIGVVEASDGESVVPGRLYLAPGGHHLALARSGADVTIALNDGPKENSCRPAADVLFRSAADVYGGEVLAVVLTGMGRDGLRGSEHVRAAGGCVIAQTPSSAVVASMPQAVAEAGIADAVIPLDAIAAEVARRVTEGR
jgi:two-component system chemotaxis response regulator CheB